ncbi:MAG: 2-hydroxyglutaryl-CoA dehydratase, partial [Chloroflexi bacterium]|nr:2-hydroxyglutaryl-CoA dehydratase [Chloroflexota bacterium]
AAAAKAVVIRNDGGRVTRASSLIHTGRDVRGAGDRVLAVALTKIGFTGSIEQVDYIVATGYGRVSLPYAHMTMTEIACHARGAHSSWPKTRFIIDIGGQDSKAIKVDEKGRVTAFVMNDKCAAGSGRFLEVMADVLETDIEDFGEISLQSKDPCPMSSICTVFAESEMVALRAERKPIEDLVAGIHYSIARRVAKMAAPLGFVDDIVFTGGVAKNVGMRRALEEEIGRKIVSLTEDPQLNGALGAALFAEEVWRRENGQ